MFIPFIKSPDLTPAPPVRVLRVFEPGRTVEAPGLTEADVRRIVREELSRALLRLDHRLA